MKRIQLLCVLISIAMASAGQVKNPAKWNFSAKKVAEKIYELHITVTIASPWNIYSQTTPEGGPQPTVLHFSNNPLLVMHGKVKEVGTMKKKHEEVFGVDVYYYKDKVDFVQVVKLKKNVKTSINGIVEFMLCNDSECLPPAEVPFTIQLP